MKVKQYIKNLANFFCFPSAPYGGYFFHVEINAIENETYYDGNNHLFFFFSLYRLTYSVENQQVITESERTL
jgi:hypothetical protein